MLIIRILKYLLVRRPVVGILLIGFLIGGIICSSARLLSPSVSSSVGAISGREAASIFEGFDNEKGADDYLVPNIIHFIRLNQTEFSFIDYVVLMAANRNHGPDFFYIHTDIVGGEFTGKYWQLVKRDRNLRKRIRIIPTERPEEIFGRPIRNWPENHRWDVVRFQILMQYGGIYLDNDVFVLKNFNKYRKFEMSLDCDGWKILGNQVLLDRLNFLSFRHYVIHLY